MVQYETQAAPCESTSTSFAPPTIVQFFISAS
jgi:hypothetical protein